LNVVQPAAAPAADQGRSQSRRLDLAGRIDFTPVSHQLPGRFGWFFRGFRTDGGPEAVVASQAVGGRSPGRPWRLSASSLGQSPLTSHAGLDLKASPALPTVGAMAIVSSRAGRGGVQPLPARRRSGAAFARSPVATAPGRGTRGAAWPNRETVCGPAAARLNYIGPSGNFKKWLRIRRGSHPQRAARPSTARAALRAPWPRQKPPWPW